MAHCSADIILGHFDNPDHWEASQLKLGTEHFPFPCSLRELVLDRYDDSPAPDDAAHCMDYQELIGYLKNIDNVDISPWQAILTQTEAIGDPAIPSQEHTAILRWVGQAVSSWEEQFPLEEPLASQLRRLKPLLAAMAILDPTFLQPGLHPLHQLLDAIQGRAIGWQSRLDRVGTLLQQQVSKAVDASCAWFEDEGTDFAAVYADFAASAERDQSRADRMIQRVVETEVGKVKTAAAKREAANMINDLLEKFEAPEGINEFLKGPWYSSAKLLLLKFGKESEQWKMMSKTTETLLDSVQNLDAVADERRQYIFDVVTRLPKEMRRWLLSLHHDTEAVNEAMGLVEFAHLRILRRQTLPLEKISPIKITEELRTTHERRDLIALGHWDEGQWFSIDNSEKGVVRTQLVLKADQEQQLLFTNLAGIKVLQLDYVEFSQLATQNKVTPLFSGASFSLCLANAAGIKSAEMLEALVHSQSEEEPTKPVAAKANKIAQDRVAPPSEPATSGATKPTPETTAASKPTTTSAILPTILPTTTEPPQTDSAPESSTPPEEQPAQQRPAEDEQAPAEEAINLYDPAVPDLSSTQATSSDVFEDNLPEEVNDDAYDLESEFLEALEDANDEHAAEQKEVLQPPKGNGFLSDQGEELKARGGYTAPEHEVLPDEEDTMSANSGDGFLLDQIKDLKPTTTTDDQAPEAATENVTPDVAQPPPEPAAATPKPEAAPKPKAAPKPEATPEPEPVQTQEPVQEQAPEAAVTPEPEAEAEDDVPIDLPTGTWLGFHDGDTPMMARLAVHDPDEDNYIFVNRKGVKLRQTTKHELLELIENGLVDILETKGNFREDVARARDELDK